MDQVSLRFIKKHRRKKFPPKEIVIQRMVNCGFDREWIDQNVTLLKGEFKDSLPNAPLEKIAFLNLDCDLHQSYVDCLNQLYPKVVKGGVIIFDEYQSGTRWAGARIAIDNFMKDKSATIERSPYMERYYTIKN